MGDQHPRVDTTRVAVGLIDGTTLEGAVRSFSPQSPDLQLHVSEENVGSRPEVIAGERIAYVAFHAAPGEASASTARVRGRQLKLHLVTGAVYAVEVEATALSNPLGFYATPLDSESRFHRIFFYAHGIGAKEVPRPLGELLVSSGALDETALARGLAHHEHDRSVRLGEVLVEKRAVDPEAVEQAAALQKRRGMRIGELLVEAGWLTQEQLQAALLEQKRRQGKRLGEVLMELGLITEQVLTRTLADKFILPVVNLDEQELEPDAADAVPKEIIEKHGVLPIRSTAKAVTLAISDPLAVNALEEVRFCTRKRVDEVMALPSQLKRHIHEHLARLDAEQLEQGLEDLLQQVVLEDGPSEARANVEEISESDSTIIKLANRMILDAYRAGASDIHVEPVGEDGPVIVRLRVDGQCRAYQELPCKLKHPLVARIKIMARLDISERRKPQDGKIRLHTRAGQIELRVATLPTVHGNEDIVLRILASSKPLPPERMRFSPDNLREILRLVAKPYGLFLVVGPTGSGKTTTLHSVLGVINTVSRKIWTAEDPVEITQRGLRQVQMQPKIGLTFASALRAFLRADPDVIMVGEMRDQETASIAVESSLTGHLVLSTLHTNSAPETITRLVDMGLDPFSFADALLGVLAQRLARSLCGQCREQYAPSAGEIDELRGMAGEAQYTELAEAAGDRGIRLWRATGCAACSDTGYKGRVAVHELLVVDDALRQAIGHRSPIGQLRELSERAGMVTLMQDGVQKAVQGITDLRQIAAVCSR